MRSALADMSSELRHQNSSSLLGGNWSHARGTVRSLGSRRNKWLAFTLNVRRGDGRLDLLASSRNFALDLAGSLGTFTVDGTVFGHIDEGNQLLDRSQRPVGRLVYQRAFTPMGSDNITAVEIGGRMIAQVHYLSDFGDRIWTAPNLVHDTAPSLTEDEAMWILAVIAMRIYWHCRTSRPT